jgi:ABC-type transport system involved in multi-copper enzyme maturation permease subunit
MASVFTVLSVTVTLLAFRTVRELGLSGIGPASATLVNLGVLLPSLMGLLLGAGSIVAPRERGLLALIAAQPISRGSIATGAVLGLTGALWTTIAIGFGAALVILSGIAGVNDVPALVVLIAATLGVSASCISIGVGVTSLASSRSQAVASAVGLWIVFAIGVDLALAALAPSIHLGPTGLLAAILLDPLEAGRVLALLGADIEGTALGPFGAYLIDTFGGAGSIVILATDLVAWTVGPLLVARWALARRDLG